MGLQKCAEVQSKDCFMFSILPKDFILHREGEISMHKCSTRIDIWMWLRWCLSVGCVWEESG